MVNENELTTITLKRKTKDSLEKLKIHPNQAFDEVIEKLLENNKKEGD